MRACSGSMSRCLRGKTGPAHAGLFFGLTRAQQRRSAILRAALARMTALRDQGATLRTSGHIRVIAPARRGLFLWSTDHIEGDFALSKVPLAVGTRYSGFSPDRNKMGPFRPGSGSGVGHLAHFLAPRSARSKMHHRVSRHLLKDRHFLIEGGHWAITSSKSARS
jgi:hypothetical protein